MKAEDILGKSLDEIAQLSCWSSALTRAEEDEGKWYQEAPSMGVALVADEARWVTSVFLYCEPPAGYSAYELQLPVGLAPDMSREQVRALLGRPERSGEMSSSPFLGDSPAWDRFNVSGCGVHVSYSAEPSGISMVTLTRV